ncbi:hypothetical protein CR203_01935 [Salipaludibacillus neizhouensis]|uniref:Uncharacterized protein n=1 Tax=Salipaludibacillus neizhouensis TaxID=885475 RepID=A0A3A9KW41_9BACI|nr:hypothetical protein [Salipaludibacillus neizhouensis]RKL68826.1 hypothetical protein CR203_01935 [Salipaludibacillus neizhouensis]
MLTFEEKLEIIESFPALERKDVSLGRVNFHFSESATDKKNVVYHLHPNGNGFVYAGELTGYETNDKGMVNIRDFTEKALRNVLENAIVSLTPEDEEEFEEELFINQNTQTLALVHEDDLWNVYADEQLDGTFTSYKEATQYLTEEGFTKI